MILIAHPTYNQAKYLAESLDNIIAQSYKDWEMVIAMRPGNDNTEDILKKYCDRDKRITYFVSNDNCPEEAVNEIFKRSKGEYETAICSDNRHYSNWLQVLMDNIGDYDVVYSDYDYAIIDENGKEKECHKISQICDIRYEKGKLLKESCYLGASYIWRRSIRELAGEFVAPMGDYDLWLRMEEAGAKIKMIKDVLLHYRQHPGSITSKAWKSGEADAMTEKIKARARERLKCRK